MKKIFAGVLATVLSFTATAQTVQMDKWTYVKNAKAMTMLNVNRGGDILSFSCEKGIGAWVSLENRFGTAVVPDQEPNAVRLELLIVDSNGELVRWTKDDLDFNKPNGAGQQRVDKLFEVLRTAKKVEALVEGEMVERFEGSPQGVLPEYNTFAEKCKV